jgi:curved DNA-binding protein CbpA
MRIIHSIVYNRTCVIIIIKRFNHYQTLNVKTNASLKEIKDSYYKMSKKYHPDVNKDTNSEEKFKEIQAAYHVLGDEKRKLEYDNRGNSTKNSYENSNDPFNQSPINFNSEYRRKWKMRDENRKNYGGGGGASRSYNFEDYFQGHYGEQLRREQIRRHRAIAYEQLYRREKAYRSAMDNEPILNIDAKIILFSSIFFFFSIVMYTSHLKAKEDEMMALNSLKHKNKNENLNK